MPATVTLLKGFETLGLFLQEASASMGHAEVRSKLQTAISDAHSGSGKYGYYVDHTGDGSTGDCIYSSEGAMCSAPYSIGEVGGKSAAHVDISKAEKVTPRVSYQPVADDVDNYTAMEAAGLYTAGSMPLSERFIAKDTRDKADPEDFAGKGKSFPILAPEDIGAAVQSMGRAGAGNHSANTLKSRIVAIAKRKGWTSHLPKSWQGEEDMASEAASIDLTGDVIPLKEGAVGQDGTVYLKLIQPGWGSCGYYPQDVLERDGPKIFTKGTKNFWNHQTAAEEAARPEGDLRDLASVLTEDAHYDRTGPNGPGLYARGKVFENFRQPVDDLAKHIGVSIRASGKAKQGTAPDGRKGPIIEALTSALSADYVTTPGAGGAVLQLFEAARKRPVDTTNTGDVDMTEAEARKLQESVNALTLDNRKMKERMAVADAAGAISTYFDTIRVGEAVQKKVTRRLLEGTLPYTADGSLDKTALAKLAESETISELDFIKEASGGRIVHSMGAPAPAQLTEAQKTAIVEAEKEAGNKFASLFELKTKAGNKIMREGRSAFDVNYNSGEKNGMIIGSEAA